MRPLLLASLLAAGPALAQTEVSARLLGHAALPADTLVAAPAEAGAFHAVAGKFANDSRQRNEQPGSVKTNTFVGDPKLPRASGGALPVAGQPVQGFSGLVALSRSEFLALTDNGFGNKPNSPDALLMVHRLRVDWDAGRIERAATVFLRDPERRVPFLITNENTRERFLTGSDFDPESIQVVGDEWWIGEEFGPYILRVGGDGVVRGLIDTVVQGKPYRGPDHYLQGRLPNTPAETGFEVRRSGGFEPLGKSPDGTRLYAMFEWPLWDGAAKDFEKSGGRPYTRILELDAASRSYTGRQWKYRFEDSGHVAADLQLLDATTALVIERDDASEGLEPACPGEARTDCFTRPAKFKRVYKIDFAAADAEGFVRKVAFIDLTKIDNPQRRARLGTNEARFAMPHLGPESLALVDGRTLVVGNDNNYPYSSARRIGRPDDNELALLDIGALVDAK